MEKRPSLLVAYCIVVSTLFLAVCLVVSNRHLLFEFHGSRVWLLPFAVKTFETIIEIGAGFYGFSFLITGVTYLLHREGFSRAAESFLAAAA